VDQLGMLMIITIGIEFECHLALPLVFWLVFVFLQMIKVTKMMEMMEKMKNKAVARLSLVLLFIFCF
jgi:hypothetical protein